MPIILYRIVPLGMAPPRMSSSKLNTSRCRREKCIAKHSIEGDPPLNRRSNQDRWGHKQKKKEDKIVRASFVNINGIGSFAKHMKSEDLRQYMVDSETDVMGIAETNVTLSGIEQNTGIKIAVLEYPIILDKSFTLHINKVAQPH